MTPIKKPIALFLALLINCCSRSSNIYNIADHKHTSNYMHYNLPKENGYYKLGKPYKVKNICYYPTEDHGYDAVGIASWYGPGFNGKLTANGEIYNQRMLTAAHKTLPMPSIVRVTNLENGRQVVVKVNDRGPFKPGRVIDLSERAAELLNMKHKGIARVRVQILPEETNMLLARLKNPPPGVKHHLIRHGDKIEDELILASNKDIFSAIEDIAEGEYSPDRLYLQYGFCNSRREAQLIAGRLEKYGGYSIDQIAGKNLYKIKLGPYKSVFDAQEALSKIKKDIGYEVHLVEVKS